MEAFIVTLIVWGGRILLFNIKYLIKRFCLAFSVKKFPKELKKSFVCYDSSQIYIFAGVFGMTQHSSFLKFALDSMKLNFEKNPNYKNRWFSAKTGPVFFTTMFLHFYDTRINMISDEYLVRKSDKSIIYQVDSSVLKDIQYIPLFSDIWHGMGVKMWTLSFLYFN